MPVQTALAQPAITSPCVVLRNPQPVAPQPVLVQPSPTPACAALRSPAQPQPLPVQPSLLHSLVQPRTAQSSPYLYNPAPAPCNPASNPSVLDRVYHMFMYHDTVHGLWTALTQMYAHTRNESRIFELYREISHASRTSFGLSVADYFEYLQTRWEELAQYEPFSDFPSDGAVESKRLDRRHTYQFLMGLKSEFEALRTQILNTSPLPSLYEAFAIVDGDEQMRRLLPSPSLPKSSPIVPDQRAFAATSGNFPDPVGVVVGVDAVETEIAQLQSHLGLAITSQSSRPTAVIVAETPTALHADELIHPRPLPILEPPLSTPPPNGSLPPIASQDSDPHAQALLPVSSLESGISPPLVSDIPPPQYPTRVRHPPSHFLLFNSTNHPIAQYMSYHGLFRFL
ncbi:hypothetical protein Acr_03g0013850 [Actinidia rufa]|uniref:Uncharacterized protein n=1 Tax=Actinidia rufa TaxID=165716 RepID=A0A7J0EDR3_9ERIC|nr:hypothetical protein Acr_03g0013850 [Actinidia rufa]